MKKISFIGLIALALSFIPLSGFAQTVQEKMITCLVLTETNGTKTEFALESFPVITIEGNDLVITCKDQKLTTALTGVQDYHFIEKKVTAGIVVCLRMTQKVRLQLQVSHSVMLRLVD